MISIRVPAASLHDHGGPDMIEERSSRRGAAADNGVTREEAMTFSPAEIGLMRESFRLLQHAEPAASQRFYERLFEIAPELRSLFRSDMTEQGMRFMSTLGVILDNLHDPEALQPYVANLARGHAAYGVRPEHFRPMGQALIDTMRETLGEDFPEGAEAAWRAAYDHLAREMIRIAGSDGAIDRAGPDRP